MSCYEERLFPHLSLYPCIIYPLEFENIKMQESKQKSLYKQLKWADCSQSIIVQALDQIMNFVTSDGWVVELFVDVWTVAE
jgi:hypothetical protein